MSIRTLLMPWISQRLFSRDRLLARRAKTEHKRLRNGAPHEVHYFHQVDDPYSALAAANLQNFTSRYDIVLCAHIVGPPPDAAAPERAKLVAYSRRDAQLVAKHVGLPFNDPGWQPDDAVVQSATVQLVAAIDAGRFVDQVGAVSEDVWRSTELAPSGQGASAVANGAVDAGAVTDEAVAVHLRASNALRESLGHYLGGMFFYAGEWYWGIDRLYHLEQRLQDLGVQRAGTDGYLIAPTTDVQQDVLRKVDQEASQKSDGRVGLAAPMSIDFFVSLRSPYSAIVAKRVFDLGRHTGAPVRIRYVLPMVMRGIPFGRINDPVGKPTERGLALIRWQNARAWGKPICALSCAACGPKD